MKSLEKLIKTKKKEPLPEAFDLMKELSESNHELNKTLPKALQGKTA
jgi:hypothetical protein